MVYSIQNEQICASIQSLGAQLCSLREASTGREHLWQGDPAVWNGQAPLLFPNIGRLRGDVYRLGNREYSLPKHGFARRREFALESQSSSQLTLLLRDDEQTRASYPFSFELRLTFSLEGNALSVRHSVVNTGEVDMPFCLGAHPGFFCAEGDVLALDAPETLALYRLDGEKGLMKDEPVPYPVPEGRFALSSALFQKDAMVFDGIRSRSVTLLRQDGARPAWACGASRSRRCATCAWSPGLAWAILSILRASFPRSVIARFSRRGRLLCSPCASSSEHNDRTLFENFVNIAPHPFTARRKRSIVIVGVRPRRQWAAHPQEFVA